MSTLYIDIGQRIRKHRKDLKQTLEELAEKAHISVSFLGEIELGRRISSIATLHAISKSLKIPLAALFSEDHEVDYNEQIAHEISSIVEPLKADEKRELLTILKSVAALLKRRR